MASISLIKRRVIAQLFPKARFMCRVFKDNSLNQAAHNNSIIRTVKINIPSSSIKELDNVPITMLRGKNLENVI